MGLDFFNSRSGADTVVLFWLWLAYCNWGIIFSMVTVLHSWNCFFYGYRPAIVELFLNLAQALPPML